MTALAAQILARLGEAEEVARAASFRTWRYDPTKVNALDREESVFAGPAGEYAVTVASTGPADDPQSMADAAHIAANDPDHVLRLTTALRKVVELHATEGEASPYCGGCGLAPPCPTLAALASVWDEPGDSA